MKTIKLLLIEDNRILRDGIVEMLRKHKDISMLKPPGRNESSILTIHRMKPDVILLDLGLRSLNSLRVVKSVNREFPKAKVIVLDLAPVRGDIIQFVNAGASGFVLKDSSVDQFLATIRAVAGGKRVLLPAMTESLFSRIVEHAVRKGRKHLESSVRMTRPEREIVRLLGEGFTNKEIGRKLDAPAFAIKSHIHNIMDKLALHARLEISSRGRTDKTPSIRVKKKKAGKR